MKSYRTIQCSSTPQELALTAVVEMGALANELKNWMSNMEGTNLESGEKYKALSDVVAELEKARLPEPKEWPHSASQISFVMSIPKRKNRAPSRQTRFENAVNMTKAVISFYESLDNGTKDYSALLKVLKQTAAIQVTIPGMYG